jgi:hypothetical protein
MRIFLAALLAAVLSGSGVAADSGSWQELAALRAGQRIEVATPARTSKGEFVRFDAQTLTIRDKQGEHAIAQAEVSRVTLPKSNRGLWIGAISGGAGGAIAGAALGTRLANESGGDFNNLKPVIAVGCAAGGALIGLAIGAAFRHNTVIYRR